MMMYFGLLSLLIGGVLAASVPVGQFAAGLLTMAVAGFVIAAWRGLPVAPAAMWTAVLFASAQVGYGLAVGVLAYRSERRRDTDSQHTDHSLPISFLLRAIRK